MLKLNQQVLLLIQWENSQALISSFGVGGMMCGWLPIFDTMNGVRGEVNVQVVIFH